MIYAFAQYDGTQHFWMGEGRLWREILDSGAEAAQFIVYWAFERTGVGWAVVIMFAVFFTIGLFRMLKGFSSTSAGGGEG